MPIIAPTTSIAQRPHLATLEGPGPLVPDGEGGWTESPVALTPATWFCQIRPATVRDLERLTTAAVVSEATYVITGPYHPGITTDTVIKFRGRTFHVNDAQSPDERQIESVLFCTEEE